MSNEQQPQPRARGSSARVVCHIPRGEAEWLTKHCELSASGLLTQAIRREMLKEKEFIERRRTPEF